MLTFVLSAFTQTVCVTFDDGPNGLTVPTIEAMNAVDAHGTYFFNAHKGSSKVLPAVKAAIEGGHGVQGHGHQHATVYNDNGKYKKWAWPSMRNYKALYGSRDGSDNFKAHPDSRKELIDNWQKNTDRYEALAKDNGLTMPEGYMSLWRFCGDGRFFKGLIQEVQKSGKTPDGSTPHHVGWNFECATNEIKWGHLPHTDWQGVSGVRCSQAGLPRDKAIILLHEAHFGVT